MTKATQSKLIKRVVMSAAALALLAFFVYAFLPSPVPVDMAVIERGPLRVQVSDEGYTRVRDVYVLSAPVGGHLLRVSARVGDPVVAGETVLTRLLPGDPEFLDARSRRQAEAAVRVAEAALNLARAERGRAAAELEYAEAEAVRARHMESRDGISKSALDRAELAVKAARAALETARAAQRMREAELENARALLALPAGNGSGDQAAIDLVAPVSGRVLRLLEESETVVAAGTPLIELGDPADMEAVVDLLSRDAVQVRENAPVTITGWGGEQPLQARVRRVEPYGYTKVSALGIEEQRVNVIIDITDAHEQWRDLGHGYRVDAAITVWQAEDVLQVPAAALLRQAGEWAVYRVSEGRARLTTVSIGQNNGQSAAVLDGLRAGDRVVLHPSERIEDGVGLTEREI